MLEWGECYAVNQDPLNVNSAYFLLKFQTNYLKTVQLDFTDRTFQILVSVEAQNDVIHPEVPTSSSYGIINEDE